MIHSELLTFLRGIKQNNNKEWYEEHKDEYNVLRQEFTQLLGQIRDEVITFDTAVARNHKKGIETIKVFRLHRDARFSRNKAKYKTTLSGLISADVKDPTEPVYYFAIAPDDKSFMGGGIRMPDRLHLDTMREYISTHHKKIQKLLSDSTLEKYFPHGLSTAYKLKKAPQGYDVTHPGIDLLRHKDFTIGCGLSDTAINSKHIKQNVVTALASLQPINAVLRKAGAATPQAHTFEYLE
jgi:uncharacterized protein (TIGR02453 family)